MRHSARWRGQWGDPLKPRNLLVLFGAALAWPIALGPAIGAQVSSKAKIRMVSAHLKELIGKQSNKVEIVTFADRRLMPVKVVRGKGEIAGTPSGPDKVETITFADPRMKPVRVVRGATELSLAMPDAARRATGSTVETVTFADPRDRSVTVLRGLVLHAPDFELFRPASTIDIDRVAFAVDGVESSHGADLRMWRPEPSGPQGPMQVSQAAATDLGGGDRFDLVQNRLLGRAYLARMYRRYGNWSDAIAAYNWGPGNIDSWIGEGRPADILPLGVERYRNRVLREVGLQRAPAVSPSDAARQLRASVRPEPGPGISY